MSRGIVFGSSNHNFTFYRRFRYYDDKVKNVVMRMTRSNVFMLMVLILQSNVRSRFKDAGGMSATIRVLVWRPQPQFLSQKWNILNIYKNLEYIPKL